MESPLDRSGFRLPHGISPPKVPTKSHVTCNWMMCADGARRYPGPNAQAYFAVGERTMSPAEVLAAIDEDTLDVTMLPALVEHTETAPPTAPTWSGWQLAGVTSEVQKHLLSRGFDGRFLTLLGSSETEARTRAKQVLAQAFQESDLIAVVEAWRLSQAEGSLAVVDQQECREVLESASVEVSTSDMVSREVLVQPPIKLATASYTEAKRDFELDQLLHSAKDLTFEAEMELRTGIAKDMSSFASRMQIAQARTQERMLQCRASAAKGAPRGPEERVDMAFIRSSVDAAKAHCVYAKISAPCGSGLCEDLAFRKR